MIVLITLIGVFICMILAIHTFITSNVVENACVKLRGSIDEYYSKSNNAETQVKE